jgi:micrococcal nuclease
MYEYSAHITGVYDGDTVTAVIDLGFNVSMTEKLRLVGIDAPEMRGESAAAGTASRDTLRSKILDKKVVIKTSKDKKEKYGRYLAEIFIDGVSINQQMITEGFAIKYDA